MSDDAPKPPGSSFDQAEADRVVKWIESNLRHFKGKWAGMPFYLMAWEKRLIRELFGWKRKNGSRLYRSAYRGSDPEVGLARALPPRSRGATDRSWSSASPSDAWPTPNRPAGRCQ